MNKNSKLFITQFPQSPFISTLLGSVILLIPRFSYTNCVLPLISEAKFHAYKNNKQKSVSVYFKWARIA